MTCGVNSEVTPVHASLPLRSPASEGGRGENTLGCRLTDMATQYGFHTRPFSQKPNFSCFFFFSYKMVQIEFISLKGCINDIVHIAMKISQQNPLLRLWCSTSSANHSYVFQTLLHFVLESFFIISTSCMHAVMK